MSKIEWLEKLQHKTTGFSSIRGGEKMACVSVPEMSLGGSYEADRGVEYVMRVEVGTLYRLPVNANDKERRDAYKATRRALSREIFKEVLDTLDQIERCIVVGELEEALNEIKNIRDQINF